MHQIWSITADDYIKVVEIARELGVKPGESIEPIFLEYMALKGQRPIGNSELTTDEFLAEYASKGKKILHQQIDLQGHTTTRIIKKREEEE